MHSARHPSLLRVCNVESMRTVLFSNTVAVGLGRRSYVLWLTRHDPTVRSDTKTPGPDTTRPMNPPRQPTVIRGVVRTLDIDKVTRADYLDLSDIVVAPVKSGSTASSGHLLFVSYSRRPVPACATEAQDAPQRPTGRRPPFSKWAYLPFPANTHGCFYFYRNPTVPAASGVRFRVTPKDEHDAHGPAGTDWFARGQDLQTEHGTTWEIPLLVLAQNEAMHTAFVGALLRDGLVKREDLRRVKALINSLPENGKQKLPQAAQVVGEPGVPFFVDLARPADSIYVVGNQKLFSLSNRYMFDVDQEDDAHAWPYEGGVLLCELNMSQYTIGHQPRVPAVNVRVLDVVETVRWSAGAPERVRSGPPLETGQLVQNTNGQPRHLFLRLDVHRALAARSNTQE
ncbi:hypothetical protein BD413DRAFT_293241 [Trametes elegans]|nr:hypothetical protein BD413DRAFT_293241 [Trametes elegans]